MIPRLSNDDFDRIAAVCGVTNARFDDLAPVLEVVLALMDPLAEQAVPAPAWGESLDDQPGASGEGEPSPADDSLNPDPPLFLIGSGVP